ncbi:MAG: hypothetical protein AAB668_01350 [Patescibacteria group bacterium]
MNALPQQTELLMGDPIDAVNLDAWYVAAFLRLRAIYTNDLVASGVIQSPFMRDLDRAREVTTSASVWFRRHGFTQQRWLALRDSVKRLGLPDDPALMDYVDKSIIPDNDSPAGIQTELELRSPRALSKLVPFRLFDEVHRSRRVEHNAQSLLSRVARDGFRPLRAAVAAEAAELASEKLGRSELVRTWLKSSPEELDRCDDELRDVSEIHIDWARHKTVAFAWFAAPSYHDDTSEPPLTRSIRESKHQVEAEAGEGTGHAQGRSDAITVALSNLDPPAPAEPMLHEDDAIERHEDLFAEVTLGHPPEVIEDVRRFLQGDLTALRPPPIQRDADGFVINPDRSYAALISRLSRHYVERVEIHQRSGVLKSG